MTDTRTVGQELQGQILDAVRKSQEAVVDGLKAWADAVRLITPPPKLSPILSDKLPKPGELVASVYDLAELLLAGQRKFAEDVLEVTAPAAATTKDSPKTAPAASVTGPAPRAGSSAKPQPGPAPATPPRSRPARPSQPAPAAASPSRRRAGGVNVERPTG
jgi:hypothetical protein